MCTITTNWARTLARRADARAELSADETRLEFFREGLERGRKIGATLVDWSLGFGLVPENDVRRILAQP